MLPSQLPSILCACQGQVTRQPRPGSDLSSQAEGVAAISQLSRPPVPSRHTPQAPLASRPLRTLLSIKTSIQRFVPVDGKTVVHLRVQALKSRRRRQAHCPGHRGSSQSALPTALGVRYRYPHFTGRETKGHRGEVTRPGSSLQHLHGFLSQVKRRHSVTQWAEVRGGGTLQPGLHVNGAMVVVNAIRVFIRCQEFWTLDRQNGIDSSGQTRGAAL